MGSEKGLDTVLGEGGKKVSGGENNACQLPDRYCGATPAYF